MRHCDLKRLIAVFVLLTLPVLATAQETAPAPGPTLNSVLARGEVNCGVNQNALGFGYLDPNTGEVRGFEVDLCRALAAAIFGDVNAVNVIPLDTQARGLRALQDGEIDVLMRSAVWQPSLDSTPGLTFGPVFFHNGQSVIVRADSGLDDWKLLDGSTICVTENSTAQTALARVMANQAVSYQALALLSAEAAEAAFSQGQCEAYSADRVQLENFRRRSSDPAALRVWDTSTGIYTSEPYAPIYRAGDDQWADIVNWSLLGLIHAEELGITGETLARLVRQDNETPDEYAKRVPAEVARFLASGQRFGLAPGFIVAAIREVGNYGEIYMRHFGATSDLPIERGPNRLWRDGGLLYSPDWG